MRLQDWAFVSAIVAVLGSILAVGIGRPSYAAAGALAAILAAGAARAGSRAHPGPMSHALRAVLRLPRGPHSPARLRAILEPRPGDRILEVGAGIGIHALPIAEAVSPGGVVDAVDIQEEMVRDLRNRARSAGVSNLVATQGDASSLAYPDERFDAIYLITVLGEVPDPEAALRELRRVIQPNGRLVIGEMLLDPDFVRLGELEGRAGRAGFVLERTQGPRFAYFARFHPA